MLSKNPDEQLLANSCLLVWFGMLPLTALKS